MGRSLNLTIAGVVLMTALLAACGESSPTPTAPIATSPTPFVTPTPTQAPTLTPAPTLAATVEQLTAVGGMVYVPCTSATCPSGGAYTTCESGHAGSGVYSSCPLTARLIAQLTADTTGVISAPDPLGGGQDPIWQSRTVTAVPSTSGGLLHVVLGFMGGGMTEKFDLFVVLQGGQLLVDDVYCTGKDPATSDAYAPGWLSRSTCTS